MATPLLFILLQLILWCGVFKLESLKYSFSVKDFESAKEHLGKIYRTKDPIGVERLLEDQHEAFDTASGNNHYSPGYISVLCDSSYCVATWFAMALAFFNQFSGVNCITIYSSDLFSDLNISPTIGSAMVGVF